MSKTCPRQYDGLAAQGPFASRVRSSTCILFSLGTALKSKLSVARQWFACKPWVSVLVKLGFASISSGPEAVH